MKTGDRVDVVLDFVLAEWRGHEIGRVFVRLADAPAEEGGRKQPPALAGATRAVWQTWLGVADEQQFMGALAIDFGPVDLNAANASEARRTADLPAGTVVIDLGDNGTAYLLGRDRVWRATGDGVVANDGEVDTVIAAGARVVVPRGGVMHSGTLDPVPTTG